MRSLLALGLAFVTLSVSANAYAAGTTSMSAGEDNSGREFLMSCTYGVLAGSLVGAASLAFTSEPGKSLNRVARGASLGLYFGILLGLYAVYIVPGLEANPDDVQIGALDKISFFVEPTFRPDNSVDGFAANWTALRF